MMSSYENTTMSPDKGDNSSGSTHSMTLHELNAAEVQLLIPTFVYLAVLSVIGIIGNSFVCHVYRTRYRLSNSQCFILCLSAIDLFSCSVVIPLEAATVVNQYAFEYLWLCKLSRFFNTLGTLSASFLLLFIAIDRYRKVCRPFGWQIKSSVAKFLCVLSVLLGLLFSWPAIFIYGKQRFEIPKYGLTGTECSTDDSMLNTMFPLINTAVFGGLFLVGIISICILYCLIGREVRKHAKKMPRTRATSVPMLSSSDDRNSRVSGEIDPGILAKQDNNTKKISKRKAMSKRKSKKCDSESSWTDRKDFELSCSMDCSQKEGKNVVSELGQSEETDAQSDDSGIRSDQTNKDETDDNSGKGSNEECTEAASSDKCPRHTTDTHEQTISDLNICDGGITTDSQTPRLECVMEHDDTNCAMDTDNNLDAEVDFQDITGIKHSRKISELSCTSEIIKPNHSLRSRLSSIGSRISTAVILRLTSLVSTTSAGSVSAAKTQYLKQARARKTAFLMFLISLAFVLSYMPHLLLMITRVLVNNFVEDMSDKGRAVYKFFLRSYFLNCAINPVIYGVCDTRFRTACKEIFSRCCRRAKSHDVN